MKVEEKVDEYYRENSNSLRVHAEFTIAIVCYAENLSGLKLFKSHRERTRVSGQTRAILFELSSTPVVVWLGLIGHYPAE